jgi:hypothetical protein
VKKEACGRALHSRHQRHGEARCASCGGATARHPIHHLFGKASRAIDHIAVCGAKDAAGMAHTRPIARDGTPRIWIRLPQGGALDAAATFTRTGCPWRRPHKLIHLESLGPAAVLDLFWRHGLDARLMPAPAIAA